MMRDWRKMDAAQEARRQKICAEIDRDTERLKRLLDARPEPFVTHPSGAQVAANFFTLVAVSTGFATFCAIPSLFTAVPFAFSFASMVALFIAHSMGPPRRDST